MERMMRCAKVIKACAALLVPAALLALTACTMGDLPMRASIESLGLNWKQVASLSGDTTLASDEYGLAVSISGDWAAVGCPGETISANSAAGAVYLYERVNGSWQRQQKLGGAAANAYFGRALALSGAYLLVGAPGLNGTKGGASLFTLSGGVWGSALALSAPAGAAGDYFGNAVALNGDWAFVGAPYSGGGKGSVYAYSRTINSPGPWGSPSNAVSLHGLTTSGEYFGSSLAVSGSYLVAGSPFENAMPPTSSTDGAAQVFYYDGSQWGVSGYGPTATLTMTGVKAFGYSVAIYGDTILVGSPGNESAYVYSRSGSSWNPVRIFDPGSASGNLFGAGVSISSQGALVGAMYESGTASHAGRAYAFAPYATGWQIDLKFSASAPVSEALFGQAVSVSGDRALVGAYGNDSVAGQVYVFERTR